MKQKGFGILELMVVLGIIAILGAIAIPQYNEYVTRTRVTEALHHAQVYARKVQTEGATGGTTVENPPTLEHAKIKKSGKGVNTKITVTLKTSINSQAVFGDPMILEDKLLVLTPDNSSKTAQWACASNLPSELMPKVCTFDDSVGGPTPWVAGDMAADATACWDQDYAEGAGGGNGWVEGNNGYGGDQQDIRGNADAACCLAIGQTSSDSSLENWRDERRCVE
jgi:type IV pilus assembly protein PilA